MAAETMFMSVVGHRVYGKELKKAKNQKEILGVFQATAVYNHNNSDLTEDQQWIAEKYGSVLDELRYDMAKLELLLQQDDRSQEVVDKVDKLRADIQQARQICIRLGSELSYVLTLITNDIPQHPQHL